ncbi:general stress protein [Planococcus sp. FY231025]|uniref:general stress protein n=1 Tax=Planococcus sp. FY231025 TaxID=3455699 RepID=UPI003F90C21A
MIVKLTVENALQAKSEIERLESQGYDDDDIYIFAHDPRRQHDIAEALDAEDADSGFMSKLKNLTTSRGDQLRSEMQSVGLTKEEADQYEEELDKGKLVIIAKKD